MATVTINLPHHTYDIRIEPTLIDSIGEVIHELAPHERAALIADETVFQIHGKRAVDALEGGQYQLTTATMPSGEDYKTLDFVRRMYDVLLDAHLERRSPVIALGGGVTGDTVGFIASSYLRGVPFVQVPTTLLAMVDASVGGKVGVNVPQGKNLIGAFYQPAVVLMDPILLQTLPPRELRCGLAECIKHGVIRDPELFEWIKQNMAKIQSLDTGTMVELLERNVQIKADVVMEDEKESGGRAHLNFGHTFAHAIEATAGYGVIHHGEAVGLGMIAASHLGHAQGLCDESVIEQVTELVKVAGLPTNAELVDTDQLMSAMKLDKKVKDNRIRFVLPTRIGEVVIYDQAPDEAVRKAWKAIHS